MMTYARRQAGGYHGDFLPWGFPMNSLAAFPINSKWPAQHPERLQLYSLPTPNGVKVSIMLEELGLPYEAHKVSFDTQDQLSPEFMSLNPNNKIPAIIDPNGPSGQPLALFESGAILIYLAEKTSQLLSEDPATRYETLQWLMFQMAGIGPMFGQVGFFNKFAGKAYEDKRPRDRYVAESRRLLAVLEKRLLGRTWIMGVYARSEAEGGLDCLVSWPGGDLADLAGSHVRLGIRLERRGGMDPRLYAVYLRSE